MSELKEIAARLALNTIEKINQLPNEHRLVTEDSDGETYYTFIAPADLKALSNAYLRLKSSRSKLLEATKAIFDNPTHANGPEDFERMRAAIREAENLSAK